MNESLKTVDSMSASELDSKLQHSYDQSIAGEGRLVGEVLDALEQKQATRYGDELQAALAEYDEMKRSPGSYKRYESFDAVSRDVFEDKPLNESIDNESLGEVSKRLIEKNKEAYDELAK